MKTRKFLALSLICLMGGLMTACNCKTKTENTAMEKAPYQKKYTNADYYTDGKFNEDVALKAMLDMFEHYGIVYNDFLKENIWVVDFGLGDFENVGMAGVFWINDPELKYFGHEIYLLPGQMIVEHRHVPTEGYPAKFETWLVRDGWAYNFSIGDTTPNPPALPASQKDHISVSKFYKQNKGDISSLVEIESPHFLIAGSEGAIITEFGTYHDGAGLRFTNPNASL